MFMQTLKSGRKFHVLLEIVMTSLRHSVFIVQTHGILKYHMPPREMPNCKPEFASSSSFLERPGTDQNGIFNFCLPDKPPSGFASRVQNFRQFCQFLKYIIQLLF